MQERLPLDQSKEKVLLDVNSLAIYLVEDHPGNDHISEEIEKGFTAKRELVVMDYLPFRVYWVHTKKWGIEEKISQESITSFLESKTDLIGIKKDGIIESFKIAEEKDHDVYDCFYISLARQADATHILTTDRDFSYLCEGESFEYLNPVPDKILSRFYGFNS